MMKVAREVAGRILRAKPLRAALQSYQVKSSAQRLDGRNDSEIYRVLVVGVYVGSRANTTSHLVRNFLSQAGVMVEQRWIALGRCSDDPAVRAVTIRVIRHSTPKSSLLNILLAIDAIDEYDYIVVSDDDIFLRKNFLPAFLDRQALFGFALAQPARTWNSYYDLSFPLRRPWLKARRTRFVECGPLFSINRVGARLMLPFDEEASMWGVDLVWPVVLEQNNLTLGIIDDVPVDHSFRPQAVTYDRSSQQRLLSEYLSKRPHLSMAEAHVSLVQHRSFRIEK